MTHKDINNFEPVNYVFDTEKKMFGITGWYDKNTDAIVFSKGTFDCVARRYLNGKILGDSE